MRAFEAIHYCALAICFICGLILTLLSTYHIYRGWNAPWLVQRNKFIIVLLLMCCSIYLLLGVPHTVVCAMHYGRRPFSDWPFEQHLWSTLLQNTALYGVIIGYVGQIFGLYFKHGYEKALSSNDQDGDNWFIRNKKTFGDQRHVALGHFSMWISAVTLLEIGFGFQWIGPRRFGAMGMINLLSVIAAICLSIRMWRAFPAIEDAFHIQNNILLTMRWQAAIQIFAIPLGVVRIFIDDLWLTFGVVAAIAFCLFEYYLVIHPHRMLQNRPMRESLKSLIQSNWREIIDDQEGFDAFMSFLQSKFASESLLFLCEYVQFKRILATHKLLDVARLENDEVVAELPEDLPLSSIMKELDSKLGKVRNWRSQFWKAIRALNERYIKDGADLELNIDYKLKREINKLTTARRDSDHRKDAVLRTLQSIYKEIGRMLDGSFMEFNDSDIAERYYMKRYNTERTITPPLGKAVALWLDVT